MSSHKAIIPLYVLCGSCSLGHCLYKLNSCMDNEHGNASLSLDVTNCSSLFVVYQAPHDTNNSKHFTPSKLLHDKASAL